MKWACKQNTIKSLLRVYMNINHKNVDNFFLTLSGLKRYAFDLTIKQLHSPSQALRWRSLASFSGCSAVSFTVLSASTFSSNCFLFSCISVTLTYRRDTAFYIDQNSLTQYGFFFKLQYIQEIIQCWNWMTPVGCQSQKSKYVGKAFWNPGLFYFCSYKANVTCFSCCPFLASSMSCCFRRKPSLVISAIFCRTSLSLRPSSLKTNQIFKCVCLYSHCIES